MFLEYLVISKAQALISSKFKKTVMLMFFSVSNEILVSNEYDYGR